MTQLIIKELRLMSEAPKDETKILVIFVDEIHFVTWNSLFEVWDDDSGETFNSGELSGWIPMPIYRPENKDKK